MGTFNYEWDTIDAPAWRDKFLASTDGSVLASLSALPGDTRSGKLAQRLVDRRLLKQVFACNMKALSGVGVQWREQLVKDVTGQEALASRLAKSIEVDPDLVLVDVRQYGNPLYRDPGLPLEKDVRVIDDDGVDSRLGDLPEGLSQNFKIGDEAELCVYASADSASSSRRKNMQKRIMDEILKVAKEG